MKFPYRKLSLAEESPLFGRTILKPIIPVTIRCQGRTVRYAALIDSGADFCIFPEEIGLFLCIAVRSGSPERFAGIEAGAGAVAYIHEVVLDIGGWQYKTKAGFSADIAQHGFGILGQRGFFDFVSVKFDYAKGEVGLRERPR